MASFPSRDHYPVSLAFHRHSQSSFKSISGEGVDEVSKAIRFDREISLETVKFVEDEKIQNNHVFNEILLVRIGELELLKD